MQNRQRQFVRYYSIENVRVSSEKLEKTMPNRYTYFGGKLSKLCKEAHVSVAVVQANVFLSDVMIYHGGVVNGF